MTLHGISQLQAISSQEAVSQVSKPQSRTVQTSPHTTDPRERKRHLLCSSQSSPQEWALLSSTSHSSTASFFSLLAETALQQAEMEEQEVVTVVWGMPSIQTKRAKGRMHSPSLLSRQASLRRKMDRRELHLSQKGSRELH